jgi:hypothetical protein
MAAKEIAEHTLRDRPCRVHTHLMQSRLSGRGPVERFEDFSDNMAELNFS